MKLGSQNVHLKSSLDIILLTQIEYKLWLFNVYRIKTLLFQVNLKNPGLNTIFRSNWILVDAILT